MSIMQAFSSTSLGSALAHRCHQNCTDCQLKKVDDWFTLGLTMLECNLV